MIEKLKKWLKQFEQCKEWADLVNWLTSLNQLLKQGKIHRIANEEILAKRLGNSILTLICLAQCLNQSLPNSVHALALETYSTIFELFCQPTEQNPVPSWGTRLAYYSPGLFAFYQFARLEIKAKFNELIKRFYLSMGAEIIECINGLISIMLLGLDDQSEDAVHSVEILQSIERKIGTRAFYSAIWLVFCDIPL